MTRRPPSELLLDGRVLLRHHRDEDAEMMFRSIERDRDRLARHMQWVDMVTSVQDEEKFIECMHWTWSEATEFDFGIFDAATGEYLGNIGVHDISWEHMHCELGYWLLCGHEGHGWASDAVRLLEREMFRIGFNKIKIRCATTNERSRKIPERLGYHLDGILRQDRLLHGVFVDDYVFSKLADEMPADGQIDEHPGRQTANG